MKKTILTPVLMLVMCTAVYPQLKLNVKVSASNLFRYGNGKEITVTSDTKKEYLEELADVRLFVNDFLFGFRYEYDDPIEFGKGTKSFSRRFVEFTKDAFTVRAGNFYELYEKGLALNSFENRGLGFNTQFDGVKMNYKKTFKNVKLSGTLSAGDLQYNDYLDTSRLEQYSVRAGNFSFSPVKFLTFGGSYIYTKGGIPQLNALTGITAEIFEGSFRFNMKGIDVYASYANKKTITERSQAPRGDGGYGSVTYTREGLGITLDYKNYRFNLVAPNERSLTSPVKPLPFQVPPSCIKEHSSTLLSRYPHNVDFGDEVGFQIDAFYSPKENLTINLNASLTSRHYDYEDIDTSVKTRYSRIERDLSFLPSSEDPFSPYWEVFVEAEYYYSKDLKIKAAGARQWSVLYSIVDPKSSDKISTTTFPVEVQYDFMKIYSVKLNAESQWVYNSLRTEHKRFFNQYFSLAFSRSPNMVISGNMEFSTDDEDPSGKKVWGSGEFSFKISSANTVSVSYGSERGGLKCSSGICRYVNPFMGFRLTVINNFN